MVTIYIDIETIPSEAPPSLEDMVVPRSIKKEETAKRWREENQLKEWCKEALQPHKGRIWFACMAVEDGPVEYYQDINTLGDKLNVLKEEHLLLNIVGHNVEFDRSFLFVHFLREGNKHLAKIFRGAYGDIFSCTMEMFMPFQWKHKISLDKALKALDLESHKSDTDGSKIFSMWKNKKINKAIDYCTKDVQAVRALYNKLKI